MRSPPPPNFSRASAPKEGPRKQLVGQEPMTSDPPSPYPTPAIPSRKANNVGGPIFQSPEMDESQNTRLRASPRAMSQDPSSDTDSNHSETRTDFRSILGGKNAPRREKGNKWLSELSVRKVVSPLLRSSQDRISTVAPVTVRERTGPGRDRRTSELLVCYLFRPLQSVPYTSGGSNPNAGGGYHKGGQNQVASSAFHPPIIPPKPAILRKAMDLPNNSSPNHLGQHSRSGTSISLMLGL